MSIEVYNKLVRDKIPGIIEKDGKKAVCEILNDENFLALLDQKLIEEMDEYQESKDVEELADLLEVIYAVSEARGISREKLEKIRCLKAEERGAFQEKIMLIQVASK